YKNNAKTCLESKLPARLLSGLSCGQSRLPARTVFIRDVGNKLKMTQAKMKYSDLYLKQLNYSSAEEKEFIRDHLSVERYNKGDFFLKSGEIQTNMGFVCEGLIRRYYINEKGNEITTGFTKEMEYIT